MFVTVLREHTDRPFDSMNIWLEDVKAAGFIVCLREIMSFDEIHSGLKVVSWKWKTSTRFYVRNFPDRVYVIPELTGVSLTLILTNSLQNVCISNFINNNNSFIFSTYKFQGLQILYTLTIYFSLETGACLTSIFLPLSLNFTRLRWPRPVNLNL